MFADGSPPPYIGLGFELVLEFADERRPKTHNGLSPRLSASLSILDMSGRNVAVRIHTLHETSASFISRIEMTPRNRLCKAC